MGFQFAKLELIQSSNIIILISVQKQEFLGPIIFICISL